MFNSLYKHYFLTLYLNVRDIIFMTEIILRTNEGQPRPKYIYNKCGTNIDFFYSTKVWSITITKLYIFFSLINIIFLITICSLFLKPLITSKNEKKYLVF